MPSTRKKCFSKCRKKSEKECGPKICKYINGKKYKYCRLGFKYKMDENCNITRRNKKTKMTKKQARLNINAFINKTKKNKKSSIKSENSSAANKIQKFMKKTEQRLNLDFYNLFVQIQAFA